MDTQQDTSTDNQSLTWDNLINDNIFTQMGFGNLSNEEKEKLAKIMSRTINRRALGRVGNMLTKEEQQEFMDLTDKNNNEGIQKFLGSRGINLDKIVAEEALIYKAEMIESAKVVVDQAKKDLDNKKD